ncbi:MAG: class I SAM-dependent methyltransferase [Deltaproteobacteria bacterium]|jgi:2-polyprenyl-3-methyl-5-hydroxy-6-metoxy-1,4-benzoquinol methylase|nr:class I SAM-dependent methyltransferase [Deltaproteobacteria bacterium]
MNSTKIWDFWAHKYEKLWVQKYSLKPTRKLILEEIRKIAENSDGKLEILDAGCATGQTIRMIKDNLPTDKVYCQGIDISPKMIEMAKNLDPEGFYECLDVAQMVLIPNKYNVIICTHSFPYYYRKEEILKNFSKMLTPDGYLIMVQASQNNLWDKIAMSFVKLTTSQAEYPSLLKMLKLILATPFELENLKLLKEKFYMASIFMFVCKNRKDSISEN